MNENRHQALRDKIELLLREYSDVISEEICEEEICEGGSPPDWQHPLALQHWVLILTVDDQSNSEDTRGYWMFSVTPRFQRPYITLGLVEEWSRESP